NRDRAACLFAEPLHVQRLFVPSRWCTKRPPPFDFRRTGRCLVRCAPSEGWFARRHGRRYIPRNDFREELAQRICPASSSRWPAFFFATSGGGALCSSIAGPRRAGEQTATG